MEICSRHFDDCGSFLSNVVCLPKYFRHRCSLNTNRKLLTSSVSEDVSIEIPALLGSSVGLHNKISLESGVDGASGLRVSILQYPTACAHENDVSARHPFVCLAPLLPLLQSAGG